jgi:YgiT-type zinc finger domain-containing protein
MQCSACRDGETNPGLVTLTFDRGSTTVVYRDVPAEVCLACGEQFVAPEITALAMSQIDAAIARGTELEIVRWPNDAASERQAEETA